jgi:hypothetical protein
MEALQPFEGVIDELLASLPPDLANLTAGNRFEQAGLNRAWIAAAALPIGWDFEGLKRGRRGSAP